MAFFLLVKICCLLSCVLYLLLVTVNIIHVSKIKISVSLVVKISHNFFKEILSIRRLLILCF